MTGDKSTGDKAAADPATLIRQVRVLERKLARSEESRVRLEEAKDRFDTLHRNLFRELDEQKALVDEKNNMLESLSSKLSKYLAPQIYQSIFPVVRMSRSKPSVKSSPCSSVISRISPRLPRISRRRILRAS
jgi:C-terminal processing protease CtpA/Prc